MDKKKRILFVINHMNIGGIQTALLQLLKEINGAYEVDLLCINPNGELLGELSEGINLIQPSIALTISECDLVSSAKYGWLWKCMRLTCSAWTKLLSKRVPAYLVTKYLQPKLCGYDVAISFTQPTQSNAFYNLANEVVLNACSANKKITFVHCDFLNYGGNDACNRALYRRFDVIAAVSDSVGKKIIEAIPEIKPKVTTVRNCCDSERISRMAQMDPLEYSEAISVVTVARLSPEKGLNRCIPIFKKLAESGFDVKWHVIGGGPEEDKLISCIAEHHAEDIVILHGMQNNPYRCMKNASVLLLPSYHEAAPVVFDEAKILGLPVITTNTTSAVEMVKNTGAGWVCGMDSTDIFDALKRFCQGELISITNEVYDELKPLKQFASLLDEDK